MGSNPAIPANENVGLAERSGSGLQNRLHRFDSGTRLKCPCGVMDSIPDYGSVGEGSSPSRDATILLYLI